MRPDSSAGVGRPAIDFDRAAFAHAAAVTSAVAAVAAVVVGFASIAGPAAAGARRRARAADKHSQCGKFNVSHSPRDCLCLSVCVYVCALLVVQVQGARARALSRPPR